MIQYKNLPILTNGDMTQTLYSTPVDLTGHEGYYIQTVWTGSPTGQAFLQTSADDPTVGPITNWNTIGSSVLNINGAGGVDGWNVLTARYHWVRLGYIPASGSGPGILNARVNVK